MKQANTSQGKKQSKSAEKLEESLLSTVTAFLTEVSQGMNTTKTCDLCKTVGHGTPECPRFNAQTVEERWRQVKEARLCFNCLRSTNSNHYSQECRQPKCGVKDCKEPHHRLLYRSKSAVGTYNSFAAPKRDESIQVLFQTTKANLIVDDQTVLVRVLLDSYMSKLSQAYRRKRLFTVGNIYLISFHELRLSMDRHAHQMTLPSVPSVPSVRTENK
jgi:hypothetical protein